MTVNAITSAAIELRAAVEQLATDDTPGQGAFEAFVARARALGEQWAGLADAERETSEAIASLFAPWLDLEEAFLAGAAEVVDREAANEHGAEAHAEELEHQVAMEILQAQKDRLMAVIPGLADWCHAHPRSAHHGGLGAFHLRRG